MADEIQLMKVDTKNSGTLSVFVQGNLDEKQGKTIFLTVHDMGTNHESFINFVNDASMQEVKTRSIFLHVCIPGQEDNAEDHTAETFPTLTQLAGDLICVLDKVDAKTCIAFGEGVGANVVCRFAIAFPNRVMGVCLVHCTSTTAGVMEYMKDKYIQKKLGSGMHSSAWDYLTFHKFGPKADGDYVKDYLDNLKKVRNPNNLAKYIQAFVNRADLSATLADDLKVETLLVVGSKASHLHTIYTMHQAMNREKTTLLVVDGVGDVMSEAPERLTRALVLFCKGCGVLSGVAMPGMERQRTLSASMEEADRPRRLSVPSGPTTIPNA